MSGAARLTDELAEQLMNAHSDDLETMVSELVDQANRAGGVDNITCLILQCINQ